MSLRWCESPGNAARIAALSADQAPTAIIGCPHHHVVGGLAVQCLQPQPSMMTKINYSGYRFPPEIIQLAIWLYVRFTLSFRDVENLLAERGILGRSSQTPAEAAYNLASR
jgi:hypothetical protein